MNVIILAPDRDLSPWIKAFKECDREVNCFTSVGEALNVTIDIAILWNQLPGDVAKLKEVKLISSMGAGVEHIINDSTIPLNIPKVRSVTQSLSDDMLEYALFSIFTIRRQMLQFINNKSDKKWNPYAIMPKKPVVGVVGLGAIGRSVALGIVKSGYPVLGLAKTEKSIPGVQSFTLQAKEDFFGQADIVINILPATDETYHFYTRDIFALFKPTTWFVNMGRGSQVKESDLIGVLENKLIGGAILDVFETEPLPSGSRLWDQDNLIITPHVASITQPAEAIESLMDNYRRLVNGEALLYQVIEGKSY